MSDVSVSLGANKYGKAENRVVRIYRDTPRHEIVDLNVTSQLRGAALVDSYLTGDNALVVATDTQKNTAFAFAKQHGVRLATSCLIDKLFILPVGDHAAPTIFRERLIDRRRDRGFGVQRTAQLGRERARRPLAAQDVQRSVLRRHHQPGAGILRYTADFPDLQSPAEGVLDHVLCEREVVNAEQPGQRRNHAPRLVPEKMIDKLSDII